MDVSASHSRGTRRQANAAAGGDAQNASVPGKLEIEVHSAQLLIKHAGDQERDRSKRDLAPWYRYVGQATSAPSTRDSGRSIRPEERPRHPRGQSTPRAAFVSPRKHCRWYTFCVDTLTAADDLTIIPFLGRSVRDACRTPCQRTQMGHRVHASGCPGSLGANAMYLLTGLIHRGLARLAKGPRTGPRSQRE
jgi:hypothetical protein